MAESNYHFGWEAAKIIAPFVAAGLATYVTYIRLKKENQLYIRKLKYESVLTAHKEVWQLASYMSEIENSNSVITWTEKHGHKTYIFHPQRAEEFMNRLREIYFDKGHGAFLSREVTDRIYEFRGKIFGLILAKNNSSNPFELQKPELAVSLFSIGGELRDYIRKSIELDERKLNLEK